MPGALIAFEGLDGVGKTTQVEYARRWLESIRRPVEVVQEPGSTPVGEAVRQLLLAGPPVRSAEAEFLLFSAARAELVRTRIAPALAAGYVVLADRFVDSGWAYQVYGRGIDPQWAACVNAGVLNGVAPTGVIWLRGRPHRPVGGDRMEQEEASFHRRVEEGYAQMAARGGERWVAISSEAPPEVVFQAVQQALRRWLAIPEEE